MKSISVIIPSRNRKQQVIDLLCDLSDQSLTAHEIIVVDQSDDPYLLDNCLYIQDQGGVGPCRARNLGAEQAKGDILVFLDDDVRVEPNFLELLCEPILQGRYIATCGAICDSDGKYVTNEPHFWRTNHKVWLLALTAKLSHVGHGLTLAFPSGCSAVLRSVFVELGGFDTFFDPNGAGEDREFALRLFHAGYPIYYNSEAKVKHLGSSTGGRRSVNLEIRVPILEANNLYIVAKYFGWEVFVSTSRCWQYNLLVRKLTLNPVSWVRSFWIFLEAKRWVRKIADIKKNNNWNNVVGN